MSIYAAAWIRQMSIEPPKVVIRLGRPNFQYLTPSVEEEMKQWNSVPRGKGDPEPITVRELNEEERERWTPLVEPFFANESGTPLSESGGIQHGLRTTGYAVRLAKKISKSSIDAVSSTGIKKRDPVALMDGKTTEGEIVGQFWLDPGEAVAVASEEVLCVPPYVVALVRLLPQYSLLGLCFRAFDAPRGIRAPISGILSNPTTVPVVIYADQGFAEVQFSPLLQD